MHFSRSWVRLLWGSMGAAGCLALVLYFVKPQAAPLLLASLGGSSVFLFALTSAPAAQPRALFGGHLVGALIGIACFHLFGDALWVYALAQALTLSCMLISGTIHPPAGANPIIMINAHAGWSAVLHPVLLGVTILAIGAAVWSRLLPDLPRYPVKWLDRSPP